MAGCGGHGHSHNHGHSCQHEDPNERGNQFSLYQKIDLFRLQCLNEAEEGSGKDVFKSWDERLDTTKFVESDVDEELLFNIPFTGSVKLKALIVIGGEGGEHPSEVKLFKNRPAMTFDDAGSEAEQSFELHEDRNGSLEYATKVARFSSVNHLSLYFPKNFGAETTKIYYIGLKGEFSEAHRHEVTICNYEARANPADHKANALEDVHHFIQ
ncbi:predicted protein [Nematostella vectensis]|uniref:PITH domain-containing protein n=1 Tax=Nematostella vectensis TaxID=45351 RepID=A7SMN4_NEMVE|nr:predicted protein [Nematostella vectensis]|eukprot:XP_001627117.1 predicted protein [Nematostella vectensis]